MVLLLSHLVVASHSSGVPAETTDGITDGPVQQSLTAGTVPLCGGALSL